MDNDHYDIIVIGSGPGGEGAAMQATKAGKRVALIEKYERIGGGCTHWGTIPSKALRHQVAELQAFNSNPLLVGRGKIKLSVSQFMRAANSVIDRQVTMREGFYFRNDVPVFHGHARFTGKNAIEVLGSEPGHPTENLTADSFVIATGSRPYRPANVDFDHPRIFDSDKILSLDQDLHSMTIYGAGVIGCEYASIFRGMGLKLSLVNTRDSLLDFLDDEISDALAYHLRDVGVLIHHDEAFEKIESADDGVILHLKSGKRLKSDVFLWANGRSGNTDDLGLEELGLVPTKRGHIEVDAYYQSASPHVYAVGDVVGRPGLASASYDQGRFAATHLCEGRSEAHLVKHIPTGIYTNPEISSLGPSERELTEQKVPYEVGHSFFKSIARAQITGQTAGMLKILFHRETLQILGIHCFGDQAAEIISIGQAIMSQEGKANTLLYFANTTFNYPTMAEAYRVAALNGLNRLF